jgi:hypothetical protein
MESTFSKYVPRLICGNSEGGERLKQPLPLSLPL